NFERALFGDCIDRRPAYDAPHVVGRFRLAGHFHVGQVVDNTSGSVNGVGASKVAVAVPAGSAQGDAVTLDSCSAIDDTPRGGAVNRDESVQARMVRAVPEQIADTVEIAQSFFADVRDKKDCPVSSDPGGVHRLHDVQQCGQTAAVVG